MAWAKSTDLMNWQSFTMNINSEYPELFGREWENYCREKKGVEELSSVYLFSIGEKAFFLTDIRPEDENAMEGFRFHRMFATRSMHPKESIFAIATAWHLFVWYRDNQFCGRCATKLVHSERLRMMQCPCCGNQVFPKIARR